MQEIDYSDSDHESTFALLKRTFPRRYLHLDELAKRKSKAAPRPRPNQSSIRGMRIFKRETAGAVDMCAFFFVRLRFTPPAYCLTVGVDPAIDPNPDTVAALLYSELKTTCTFMHGEAGGGTIDVVNERQLPDDLSETAGALIVKKVFNTASSPDEGNLTLVEPQYVTGCPWPPVMWRYLVSNPIRYI